MEIQGKIIVLLEHYQTRLSDQAIRQEKLRYNESLEEQTARQEYDAKTKAVKRSEESEENTKLRRLIDAQRYSEIGKKTAALLYPLVFVIFSYSNTEFLVNNSLNLSIIYGNIALITSSILLYSFLSSVIPQVTATWHALLGSIPSLINLPAYISTLVLAASDNP